MTQLITFADGERVPLPRAASPLESHVHVFDQDSIDAVNTAIAAGRPLLVRGEPGTGKSQLAEAAAVALERRFLPFVVDAKTEAQDLKWSFDAVRRLAVAQSLGAYSDLKAKDVDERLAEKHFVQPGVLWSAFDWGGVEVGRAFHEAAESPKYLKTWKPDDGCVVLIDEIDKADSDVPNGLLEALGAGQFRVPTQDKPVCCVGAAPLVVLTTNEERSLPDAFLRRCVVLQLAWPEVRTHRDAFMKAMIARGVAHFGSRLDPQVLQDAAELLAEDRVALEDRGVKPPGLAEYLDLLRAVLGMPPTKTPAEWVRKLRKFTFAKHPPERVA